MRRSTLSRWYIRLKRGQWNRHNRPQRPQQRRRRSRGQALVEFSLFALTMIYMTAGVADIGGLLDDHISLEYAVRQGARTGSVLGNQSNADCNIIDAIDASVVNMPNLTITEVQIYDAGTNGNVQNDGSGKPLMDDYKGNNPTCAISSSGGATTTTITPVATTLNYPPANRLNQPFTEDSLGVKVFYNYSIQFGFAGFFSGTFNASDYAVMPINPIAVPSAVPSPTMMPTPTGTVCLNPTICGVGP